MTREQAVSALVGEGVSDSRAREFVTFLAAQIWIWREFEARALLACQMGKRRLGAKALFEDIREEVPAARRDEFKLNNNYTSLFARLFVGKHPEHRDKFELRTLKQEESYEVAT